MSLTINVEKKVTSYCTLTNGDTEKVKRYAKEKGCSLKEAITDLWYDLNDIDADFEDNQEDFYCSADDFVSIEDYDVDSGESKIVERYEKDDE